MHHWYVVHLKEEHLAYSGLLAVGNCVAAIVSVVFSVYFNWHDVKIEAGRAEVAPQESLEELLVLVVG